MRWNSRRSPNVSTSGRTAFVTSSGPPARPSSRLLRVPPEVDRRPGLLRRSGSDLPPVVGVDLALEGEPLAGPRSPEHLDGVDGTAHPLSDLLTEHPELLLTPPEPEPE